MTAPRRAWRTPLVLGGFLALALACGGYDQSQWEGTRTHDVYGVALPQIFQEAGLPPPDVNVGMVGENTLTTYHKRKKPHRIYALYGEHLEAEGWTEVQDPMETWGRVWTKGDARLKIEATEHYVGGLGSAGTPAQAFVTWSSSVLVEPWASIEGLPVGDARVVATPTTLTLTWPDGPAPLPEDQMNDFIRAFSKAGWDVRTASRYGSTATARLVRGSQSIDLEVGTPAPGGVTAYYSAAGGY